MWIAVFLILTVFFAIQILCILWIMAEEKDGRLMWLFTAKPSAPKPAEALPMVSLLLAARNEEELIQRSLKHIDALDYPKDRIEILIGDDNSTDRTHALVSDFIADKSQYKLFMIKEKLGKGRGKANVLAHLAHEASGAYFLITDVDVALPKGWVRGMLKQFSEGVGIVSGTTMCERGNFFANLQSIDWLHFMGYIKAFGKVNVACTTVGNNMAVRAEAYWQTGGYEHIDFSITEDYKLFKEVTKRGWGWRADLSPETLGKAWYIKNVGEMLHQRKRWLIGARELPLSWKALIVLYGLFIPALIALFFIDPYLAMFTWFLKVMAQSLFITILCHKVKEKPFRFGQLLIYEIYVLLNSLSSAIFYFLPISSVWKGRTYNKHYID